MFAIHPSVPCLLAASAAAVLLLGCHSHDSRDHEGEDDHHHDEPEASQITVWGDRHELCIDYEPVVAGSSARFITHVTELPSSEPRRAGPVKFILSQTNAAPIEHIEQEPTTPGIYNVRLKFPTAGLWNIGVTIPGPGEETIALPAVEVHASRHEALHADAAPAPEGIGFTKEQQWKIQAKTEPVAQRSLTERIRVPARVRPKPGHSATLTAPVSGQLISSPNEPLPQPGQRVEAGQLIALLKPNFSEAGAKVVEAQAEFETASATFHQAETAYNRIKKLVGEQARSPRDLQEAELVLHSARARRAAATGLLATFRQATNSPAFDGSLLMELRAPIRGILNSVNAGPGELVSAHQPLFVVLNPATVWIEAQVPESSVSRLGPARSAGLESPLDPGRVIPITGDGRGQLVSLGLEVHAGTRTVPLIYETPNEETGLRLGQNVTLHVETRRQENALAIPDSALVEEGGWYIAFVQVAGETFERRELRLGIRDGEWIQVLSGLKEGERIVTRGARAIRLASAAGGIPEHGHAH